MKKYTLIEFKIVKNILAIYDQRINDLVNNAIDGNTNFSILSVDLKGNTLFVYVKIWNSYTPVNFKYLTLTFTEDDLNG